MTNYNTPNLGNIIEDPAKRKVAYKIVGIVGLLGTAITVGLAPFGITQDAYPALLAFWSVYGVLSAGSSTLANTNAPKI